MAIFHSDPISKRSASGEDTSPEERGDSVRSPLDCIGREEELARLERVYRQEAPNGGHILFLCGPRGVGKSSLLREFKRRMRLEGVGTLEACCRRQENPFEPLLSLLRQASAYLNELAPGALGGATGLETSRLVATLGRIGRSPQSGDPEDEVELASGGEKVLETVVEFLSEVSRIRPPLVVLHDIDRAAPATLRVIESLSSKLAPAASLERGQPGRLPFRGLFVMSWRSRGDDVSLQDLPFWAGGMSHDVLTMGGLERKGVAEFLKSDTVVERFTELTGGNPRNLESLLTWGSPDADEVLRNRLLSVSRDARILAVCCALMDRPLGPAMLKQLTRFSSKRIGAAIEELLKSRIAQHSVVTGELQIQFASTGDGDAVVETTPPSELRTWRLRIAEQLLEDGEKVSAAEQMLAAANGAPLTFQSERPPIWEDLLKIVLEAGDTLEVSGDLDRAIRLYGDTLSILPRKRDDEAAGGFPPPLESSALETRSRLVRLLELNGRYSEALSLVQDMRTERPEDLEALRAFGHLSSLKGLLMEAQEALQFGQQLSRERGDTFYEAAFSTELSELSYKRGSHSEAQSHESKVLALLEDLQQHPRADELRCALSLSMGKVAMERGDLEVAVSRFNEALARARAGSHTEQEIRSLVNLGIFHLKRGEHSTARELYSEALDASRSGKDVRHQAFCLQNLAVLAHWRRDYNTALKRFHEAVGAFQRLGNSNILAWLALDLGELYLELGNADRATAMAQLSRNLLPDPNGGSVEIYRALLDGRLAHESGLFLKAKHQFLRARQFSVRDERREDAATAGLELARLEMSLGNLQAAREALQDVGKPPTLKLKAIKLRLDAELTLESHEDDPRKALLEALQLFERVEDPDGQWKTQALLYSAARKEKERAEAARWRRLARRTEEKVRSSVPEELLDVYLQATSRRPYLERICAHDLDRFEEPAQAAPRWASAQGDTSSRPSPGEEVRAPAISEEAKKALAAMVGQHPRFRGFLRAVEKVASIDSTVLLRGESGTGKELAARAIHALSPRADKPLVEVNCGALVETLLLSELFGHERGAFTGATRCKKGRFELAEGGTLFLDEIGDISPRTQVALLRVLQEKTFERVGGTESRQADVRIVCATNRNLEAMVKDGTFREDLYYRLKTLELELPPLRERGHDTLLIAQEILERLAAQDGTAKKSLSSEAQSILLSHPWYGNVRELENVLRSCWIFSEDDTIPGELVSRFVNTGESGTSPTSPNSPSPPLNTTRAVGEAAETSHQVAFSGGPACEPGETEKAPSVGEEMDPEKAFDRWYGYVQGEGLSMKKMKKRLERELIRRALGETEGNITQAAKLLGMKRPRLSQLVKEHGLNKE